MTANKSRLRPQRPRPAPSLAAVLLGAALTFASPLRADVAPEDRAAADALFREGRALVKQGKYAEGCAKLAASQKLDPAAGSLLALGDCYELNGQTASAWTTFNEARALARKDSDAGRADEAQRRADLLEPKLSRLTINVPADARVPGLEVRRNGKPIDAALFGSAIPIDPGPQTIDVKAPGKRDWQTTVTVEPRPGVSTVHVPPLADAPASASGSPSTSPSVSTSVSAAPSGAPGSPPPVPFWGTQRILGAALGGAGVAGIVVGAVFGGLTFSTMGDIQGKSLCTDADPPRCTAEGLRLQGEANDTANISNVAFAAGGAVLVAGVVVFLTAPSGPPERTGRLRIEITPRAGVGTAGLTVRGAF